MSVMAESSSACFVIMIDLSLTEKLKQDLLSQGFELTKPAYTVFQAKKQGVSLSLYESGKLTVQGKNKHEFITYYLEPEILNHLAYTYPHQNVELHARIGIDEAGKGDYFGPLCIGGLYVNGEKDIQALLKMGVKDSKRLGDPIILKIAHQIKNSFQTSVIRIFPKRYNEMYETFRNLNRLLAWGHSTAIDTLVKATSCLQVIIDQFADEHVVLSALKKKGLELILTQRHKGEEDPVVAGASILARAAFVEGLASLEQKYQLSLPKGSSSAVKAAAVKAISLHGITILPEIAKMHFKTTEELLKNRVDA
jgi:ribonuclease HIII